MLLVCIHRQSVVTVSKCYTRYMSESKPYLSPVESIKPVNVQAELYAASQECSGLIDSMMYAEAFEQFAERLDNIAKQPHSPLLDEKTQVGVRRALGEAWKAFVKTSKNEKNVPQWQAQATVSAISPREKEEVETLEQDIPPETEKYFTALAKQAESERGHVVTFPNEASKKAALRRDIERRLEPEGSIVAQTHGTEALQRRYVASMFYDVIPLLRTQTEG